MARGKQFNVEVSEEVISRLRAHAQESGVTLTTLVGRILDAAAPEAPDIVKTQIRIPAKLHEKLVASAKNGRRSLNAEMVGRLAITLEGSD